MPKENQQQNFSRLDARDKIDQSLVKLNFMRDAIMYWDIKSIGIEDEIQHGYGLIMEDIIVDIKSSMDALKEC